jgi:malate dehydrogenase
MHACSYFFLVFYEMAFLSIQGLQMGGVERELTRARGAAPGFKVAVLGAAGGIGQPLSLLLKMNPLVSTLHLYDVFNTPGVTADLSHTNTSAVVCDSFLFPVVFFTI